MLSNPTVLCPEECTSTSTPASVGRLALRCVRCANSAINLLFRAPAKGAAAGGQGLPPQQQLLAARRGLQDWIGHALGSAQMDADTVATPHNSAAASSTIDGNCVAGEDSRRFDVEALEASGLPALVAAAALLEELLPAAAPGLAPGSAHAGVRNASRIYMQVCISTQVMLIDCNSSLYIRTALFGVKSVR